MTSAAEAPGSTAAHGFEREIEELKEMAADPTLQACCQQDLHDQIRVAGYKAKLAPQDRSEARHALASRVLGTQPRTEDSGDEDAAGSAELGKEWFRRGHHTERCCRPHVLTCRAPSPLSHRGASGAPTPRAPSRGPKPRHAAV